MSLPTELIERFPLGELFYILATGLFTILSFPYDLFNLDFSNGIKLPVLCDFVKYLGENFSPFVNAQGIGVDFVLGLAKIVIASFIVGLLFFIFYDFFERINNFFVKGRIKNKFNSFFDLKNVKMNRKTELDFNKWARERKISKYLGFVYSIRLAFAGLFHSAEVYFFVVVIVGLFILPSPSFHQNWLNGFYLMLIILICSYILHRLAGVRFDNIFQSFFREYEISAKNFDLEY